MKAFYFLSAVAELGISNDAYALFTKDAIIDGATFGGSILFGTIPNGSDMAAVWGDSEDGRDLIAKIKDTPVACVQTENQFILSMKWNSRRAAEVFFWACFLGALIMSLIVTSEL